MDWPYSEDFIEEFISLYEALPSLWDQRSDIFHDQEIRTHDIAILLKKLQEVEPKATKVYLIQKLSNLRRRYRMEKQRSMQNGCPMRKEYERLSFLSGITPKAQKCSKSKDPLDINSTNVNDEDIKPIHLSESNKSFETSGEQSNPSEIGLDHFDHITKAWTSSLQNASRQQQKLAEKIINSILFEAQNENLSTRSPKDVSKLLQTNW